MNVDGTTVFITGGAQGIGLGMARAFARAGARVALADIDADALAVAAGELSGRTDVTAHVLDVRDREAFAAVADEVERSLGPVGVLCNNAGVAGGADVTRLAYDDWDWILGINLVGVVNGVQTFLRRMLGRGSGHIVNTASGAGLAVGTSGVMYTTSKFGVVGLSESLRVELEPHGIGVTVLCPGPVATSIMSNTLRWQPSITPEALSTPAAEARLAQLDSWLAAGASPDEVGDMVLDAVGANRLYVHTDDVMATAIERRAAALLEAMPSRLTR